MAAMCRIPVVLCERHYATRDGFRKKTIFHDSAERWREFESIATIPTRSAICLPEGSGRADQAISGLRHASAYDGISGSHAYGWIGRSRDTAMAAVSTSRRVTRSLQAQLGSLTSAAICRMEPCSDAEESSRIVRQWTSLAPEEVRDLSKASSTGYGSFSVWAREKAEVSAQSRWSEHAEAVAGVVSARAHQKFPKGPERQGAVRPVRHESNIIEASADTPADLAVESEETSYESFPTSQLQTASLTQALTGGIGRRLTCSVGSINRIAPRLARLNFLTGPFGILMAVAVAIAGLTTAIRSHMQQSEEIWSEKNCERCSGYGVEKCDVCHGRGEIHWEGKLYHRDPCPACLGGGIRKCSKCDGMCHAKKGLPRSVKEALASRKRKR